MKFREKKTQKKEEEREKMNENEEIRRAVRELQVS